MDWCTEYAPVSVIIPCYNCEKTIWRAVDSVFAQSMEPSELLLINDASTDATAANLQQISTFYHSKRIIILDLAVNCGPASARNTGWNLATQPYIAFLDADDTWHSQKIACQYSWMREHPNAALTGHKAIFGHEQQFQQSAPIVSNPTLITFTRLLFSNPFPTPTIMLKRELPMRFEEYKRYAEDYLLWLTVAAAGHECYHLNQPLTYLYKSRYGAAGLSGQLWNMQKGELATYANLYRQGFISLLMLALLTPFSIVKYLRRLIRCSFRMSV